MHIPWAIGQIGQYADFWPYDLWDDEKLLAHSWCDQEWSGYGPGYDDSPKLFFQRHCRMWKKGPTGKHQVISWNKAGEITGWKSRRRRFTILGAAQSCKQFANLGLIDEYNLVVVPVVLGVGKSLFKMLIKWTWIFLKQDHSKWDCLLKYSLPESEEHWFRICTFYR